jgi:hypothetical protein
MSCLLDNISEDDINTYKTVVFTVLNSIINKHESKDTVMFCKILKHYTMKETDFFKLYYNIFITITNDENLSIELSYEIKQYIYNNYNKYKKLLNE